MSEETYQTYARLELPKGAIVPDAEYDDYPVELTTEDGDFVGLIEDVGRNVAVTFVDTEAGRGECVRMVIAFQKGGARIKIPAKIQQEMQKYMH